MDMPVEPIDLEVAVESLHGIKEDLESYYWSLSEREVDSPQSRVRYSQKASPA